MNQIIISGPITSGPFGTYVDHEPGQYFFVQARCPAPDGSGFILNIRVECHLQSSLLQDPSILTVGTGVRLEGFLWERGSVRVLKIEASPEDNAPGFRQLTEAPASKGPKYLGFRNGWTPTSAPPEFSRHLVTHDNPHNHVTSETIGKCVTRYTCPECNISWDVDSSD